ncbi:hypothetical protein O181_039803 [Austropuccinia psidii MF-1]|uniref:Reverse transcriptase Ty1/copia-type domain-containing protein n=1 Tax=Austropuccinia psidii MF-1 TaxID=1389203 RepID=A0A9Q3DE36_9BASI|nr:hypothetical protein [Austropuccinia psidii MF-1]
MKDLGKANFLLGIKINHLNNGFSKYQEHYIDELAEKDKIKDLIPSNTPLKPHLRLSNPSEKENEEFSNLNINYQSAIGSLNYISSNTRPDITFSKQQTVSHSTTEAKYKSLSDATKETTWLMNLINETQLTSSLLNPTLFNDNKGAIDLALSDANHSGFKTKQMDIKLHFIRELLKKGTMMLEHVPTTSMNADFLTKSVGTTVLLKSLQFLNLLKNTCALSQCSSQGGI